MFKIENVEIYGLKNSIKASKYPMATDVNNLNNNITKTVKFLGKSGVGGGHDNYLLGIIVQFDLTMPVKMSVELQRYHFIDFISSQSTIHRITKFNLDKQYDSHVDKRIIDIIKEKVHEYNRLENLQNENYSELRKKIMDNLYLEILMSNPCGFELTARMTTNYRQLKTIYHQRKNHKLPQWKEFCKWCETLPMFKEIVLGE